MKWRRFAKWWNKYINSCCEWFERLKIEGEKLNPDDEIFRIIKKGD